MFAQWLLTDKCHLLTVDCPCVLVQCARHSVDTPLVERLIKVASVTRRQGVCGSMLDTATGVLSVWLAGDAGRVRWLPANVRQTSSRVSPAAAAVLLGGLRWSNGVSQSQKASRCVRLSKLFWLPHVAVARTSPLIQRPNSRMCAQLWCYSVDWIGDLDRGDEKRSRIFSVTLT